MNQSDLRNINLFQKYEICQQQSSCYLLIPPPRPPTLPKLFFPDSLTTTTIINFRQRSDLFFILLGIFITLIFTCLILGVKFQFYRKLRHRRTTNTGDGSASFSSLAPISYDCLTPSTITTIANNQSPSLTMANNSNPSHNHSTNIYEEIRSSLDHYHCCCCSCTLAHYQQHTQSLTPYYYTCESSSANIVSQNCLLETLHRRQQCLYHHLFLPIK